ncbi:MAG: NUDIX domain-containing protein [Candidatus Micrarchaeota archaeon]|nr:NUDIX domain-containing protein [Candidatus Micrarchaeota archaeon]MDE1847526.1 NUDIX domain-containing protein [Candidatus Micrarchaeota archaeon]MDE1863838.1 NUDIX domain-containing protein [Candidatus Micrarchaeota archaeon]
MELLGEIYDVHEGASDKILPNYRFRRAARAVVFDGNGNVALMHIPELNYHKLPGGGIERGESVEEALRREVLEEVGYRIKIGKPLGIIIEYRNRRKLLQVSYCFTAKILGKELGTRFTKAEKYEGFAPMWVKIDKAISLIRSAPVDYDGGFVIARDVKFLAKAKAMNSP